MAHNSQLNTHVFSVKNETLSLILWFIQSPIHILNKRYDSNMVLAESLATELRPFKPSQVVLLNENA